MRVCAHEDIIRMLTDLSAGMSHTCKRTRTPSLIHPHICPTHTRINYEIKAMWKLAGLRVGILRLFDVLHTEKCVGVWVCGRIFFIRLGSG